MFIFNRSPLPEKWLWSKFLFSSHHNSSTFICIWNFKLISYVFQELSGGPTDWPTIHPTIHRPSIQPSIRPSDRPSVWIIGGLVDLNKKIATNFSIAMWAWLLFRIRVQRCIQKLDRWILECCLQAYICTIEIGSAFDKWSNKRERVEVIWNVDYR